MSAMNCVWSVTCVQWVVVKGKGLLVSGTLEFVTAARTLHCYYKTWFKTNHLETLHVFDALIHFPYVSLKFS